MEHPKKEHSGTNEAERSQLNHHGESRSKNHPVSEDQNHHQNHQNHQVHDKLDVYPETYKTHHRASPDDVGGTHKVGSNPVNILTPLSIVLIVIASLFIIVNQIQISQLSSTLGAPAIFQMDSSSFSQGDLKNVDIDTLKSTAHSVAAIFPVNQISTQEDALAVMFPQGTPDYGEALGVTYDDPVKSLDVLANMYPGLKAEVQKNNPDAFARYITLATKPVGISCEYCCGIGPIGTDKNGNSLCGCQHNPALLSVALYLTAYTNYNDAEILREVLRWKTLFFPKNMVELGLSVAGKDPSDLADLPGMVGGC